MKLVAVLAALCLFNAGLCLNDKEYPTNSGVQLLTSPPPTQPEQQLMTTSVYQPPIKTRVYEQPPQPTAQQGQDTINRPVYNYQVNAAGYEQIPHPMLTSQQSAQTSLSGSNPSAIPKHNFLDNLVKGVTGQCTNGDRERIIKIQQEIQILRYTPEKYAEISKELYDLQQKCSYPESMPKCTKSDRKEIRKIEEELTYTMYTPEKHAEIISNLNSLRSKCQTYHQHDSNQNGKQQWPQNHHYENSKTRHIDGGVIHEHQSGQSYQNKQYYVNGQKQPWDHKAEDFVGKTKGWLKNAKETIFGEDHNFDESEDPEWSEMTNEINHFTEETNNRLHNLHNKIGSIHNKRKHHEANTYNQQQAKHRYYGDGGQMNV